jgi:hypothetical protein
MTTLQGMVGFGYLKYSNGLGLMSHCKEYLGASHQLCNTIWEHLYSLTLISWQNAKADPSPVV